MSSPVDSRWHNAALATLITHEIMSKPLPDETPNLRLRQLGMMNLLFSMENADTPLTITAVTEVTGMARKAALETIEPLVARGLLVESWGVPSHGKGKARQFQISPEVFKLLLGSDCR